MKQLSIIILAVIAFSTNCMAQDRNNAAPAQLATKSKEIKSALYWQQDRKTGKWESRKNTTLVYLGEGVAVDNFNSLFIGEYAGRRYLFCVQRIQLALPCFTNGMDCITNDNGCSFIRSRL